MTSATQQLGLPNTAYSTDTTLQFVAPNNRIVVTGCAAGGGSLLSQAFSTINTGNRLTTSKGRLLGQCSATAACVVSDEGTGQKGFATGSTLSGGPLAVNSRGYMLAKDSSTNMVYSLDFGATWATAAITIGGIGDVAVDEATNSGCLVQYTSANVVTTVGATPTVTALPSTGTVNRMKYLNGMFAIASSKGLAYALPGKTPVEITLDASNGFNSIAYSKDLNLWVGIGNNGHIWTATANADGTMPASGSWTQRTSGVAVTLSEISWIPPLASPYPTLFTGRFVALGAAGWINSLDGVTWTACTGISGTFDRRSLAFGILPSSGAMRLVAASNGAPATVFYSSDGVAWTQSPSTPGLMSGSALSGANGDLVFGSKNFVLQTGTAGTVFISPDGGVTWTSQSSYVGWMASADGGDSIIIGSKSGELLRLKGGKATLSNVGGDGGDSSPMRTASRGGNSTGGRGEGGVGGLGAAAPGNAPTGKGGPGHTSDSATGGGAGLPAESLPSGSPRKLPGGGGGYAGSGLGGGGASSFGYGGTANTTTVGGGIASGPGAGASGESTDTLGGGGGGESAVRMIIAVQPGELITLLAGYSEQDTRANAQAGTNGFLAVELAA